MLPSHWTENDITINGISMHYIRTGEGHNPPLVLAHGFSDDGLCWLQTALDLEDRYDIIMPDARGHGRSARVEPGHPVDMTADLASIIQALDLQTPIVVGHSMGANTTFQLGVNYATLPRALVLEDPPWFPLPPGQMAGQNADPPAEHPMASWVATIQRLSLDELVALAREEHPTWPDWVIQTWCTAKKRLDPEILSALRFRGAHWSKTAQTLTCPTLIITADPERGGLVTPAVAAEVQALNAHCTVVRIPDAGHHVRFEAYAQYMETVQSFLQGLE